MVRKISKRGKKNFLLRKNPRGLSQVVTTVLLIALTIVIIAIIFLWFRGMVKEGVIKFGKNIQLVCEDVDFDASYSSGTLSVVNNGNVPLYRINLQMTTAEGNYNTEENFGEGNGWPGNGLNQGGTFSGSVTGEMSKITVIPVLIGTSSQGKKTFICGGQYGKELTV